jgi:diguanylate cyclase
MPTLTPAVRNPNQPHWMVKTHYLMRAAAFVMSFAFIGTHLAGKDYGNMVWGLLALQFLVYPHLVFWRAHMARDAPRTELDNLVLDSFLIGLWVAFLQFPLWITFTLFMSSSLNNTISRGAKGLTLALLAFTSGALIAVVIFGWHLAPETDWLTTWLCLISLTVYLLAIGKIAYGHNQSLRDTREQLRHGERARHAANKALQRQLDEIHVLQGKLSEQANRDPLTGLYNRRYLDTTLTRELARCERDGQPLSVMMIDIDHFKQVNDNYGHQAGDTVLIKLATVLQEQARAADVACRYGGEEFMLLLPNMPADVALDRAEQWRAAFADTTVLVDARQLRVTLSIGVAGYPTHGHLAQELIQCADRALYRAKAQGRNRVVLAGAESPLNQI